MALLSGAATAAPAAVDVRVYRSAAGADDPVVVVAGRHRDETFSFRPVRCREPLGRTEKSALLRRTSLSSVSPKTSVPFGDARRKRRWGPIATMKD